MTLRPCPYCGKIHTKITVEECYDRQMSERTLQDRVVARAKRRGWTVAHAGRAWVGDVGTGDGRFITPMSAGWPDLTLAKAGHRLVFLELKRENGVLSDEQVGWLALLAKCGAMSAVIRPSDLRRGVVNRILEEGYPL